jgi:hypothetical protein
VNFLELKEPVPSEQIIRERYFRLKRIMMEFASHSKGSLAKLADKINNKRIYKNEIGFQLIEKLQIDGILERRGTHYHLNREKIDEKMGVNYLDLRRGRIPSSLKSYLGSF